jgi:hypothetical protein
MVSLEEKTRCKRKKWVLEDKQRTKEEGKNHINGGNI